MTYGKRPPLDEQKSLWEASLAREGVTTGAGAATGDSFVDAGLAGAGANSFISMLAVIYPGQPRLVDSMDITAFNNATGEVTLASAYKGVAAAIPVGVPYKIVTFRFVPAEVAALTALVTALMADVGDPTGETLPSLATKWGDIARSLDLILGARWDAAGDLGTDIAALIAGGGSGGLAYLGTVSGIVGAPNFQCSDLVGYGAEFFNDYWAYVVWDAAGGGAAPQGEMLECTGYDSATGDFTVAAFGGGGIAVGDKVLLLHPSIASLLHTTYGLSAIKTLIDAIKLILDTPADFMADVAILTDVTNGLAAIKAEVEGIGGVAMRGTDGAALATAWTAALATILGNFTALRIGYLDQLDFDLQEALNTIAGYVDAEIQAIITTLGTPANFMADVSGLETSVGRALFALDMPWTTFTNQIVVSTGAADKALGSITIANIPAGAVLVDARMMVKYNGRENTNAVANSISGAQNIQAQKAVAGAWLTGIALAGGEFATAGESGDILGDIVMGTANIVAQVPANGAVIEFKWTQALAAQDNLNFNGIQVGLRVLYSI